MITRWLTYIRLFDFDVKHIAGNKNGGADALSRRGQASEDDPDDSDPDDYFESCLYNLRLEVQQSEHGPQNHTARIWLLEGEYEGQDLILGRYLETLQ